MSPAGERVRVATRVHRVGLLANAGLATLKMITGGLAGSRAVFADGLHSLTDVVMVAAVWIASRWSARPPDEEHHYGHGNGESLASVVVGLLIIGAGVGLAWAGVRGTAVIAANGFGALAVGAEVITIAVKLWLARITGREGARTRSPAMLSLHRDNRADVWTSALVLASVSATMIGAPWWIESVATVAVGLLVLREGVTSVREGLDVLMDRVDPGARLEITRAAASVPGVRAVRLVRVHPIGGDRRVDLEIDVDAQLDVAAGHELAHAVERAILRDVPGVCGVQVHVQPAPDGVGSDHGAAPHERAGAPGDGGSADE